MEDAPMNEFATALIACARKYVGLQEPDPKRHPNEGPLIADWLEWVGVRRPASWCAAFTCSMVREAGAATHIRSPLRKSAGVWRLWDLNRDLALPAPQPGCLVLWDHGKAQGHVGIVTGTTSVGAALAAVIVISGNTNSAGSRVGDSVVERSFELPFEHPLIGWLRPWP